MTTKTAYFADWVGYRWLGLVVRLYLGWLFIAASLHKIIEPSVFALDVATYQFLPYYLVNLFAIVVPWVELLIGAQLLLGVRVRAAALLVALLMLSFIIALLWALYLGLDMSCGCFASQAASADDAISWATMLRDLAWLGLSLYVLFLDRRPFGVHLLLNRKGGSHASENC